MARVDSEDAGRFLARTSTLGSADPLQVSVAAGEPLVAYWAQHPTVLAGWGCAAERVAHNAIDARVILRELTSRDHFVRRGEPVQFPAPWLGGLAFDPDRPPGQEWEGFPATRWVLPRMLVWKREGATAVTAFVSLRSGLDRAEALAHQALSALKARVAGISPHAELRPAQPVEGVTPDDGQRHWQQLVSSAVGEIERGSFEKVVLARTVKLPWSPRTLWSVLRDLQVRFSACRIFMFRAPNGRCFLGATPEQLCRIEGQMLATEALAGTGAPDAGQGLLGARKERAEHQWVVRGVIQAVQPFAKHLACADSPELLVLPNLVHLRTPIHAELHDSVDLAELILALHPTPATCGWPRNAARNFLRAHEGLCRGWYAGAVGQLGAGVVNLAVALRSALVDDTSCLIYVGAGVVEGSSPQGEWLETQAKSMPMVSALGRPHAH